MNNITPIRTTAAPSGPSFVKRDNCPACGENNSRTLYECGFNQAPIKDYLEWFYSSQGGHVDLNRLGDGVYRIAHCENCAFVYQEEILDDEMMGVLYDEWIDSDKSYQLGTQMGIDRYLRDAAEINRIISAVNRDPHTIKVMDFGMGWAQWIRMAASFGCDAYGAELSVARIEYAKNHGIKVVDWDEMMSHAFCVINTEQVFEHIPNPYETLIHLKACLKPDGLLKISVPNGAGIEGKLQNSGWDQYKKNSVSLNPTAPLEHINCFTYDSLVAMADRAGMKVVKLPLKTQAFGFLKLTKPKASIKSLIKPIYQHFKPSTYVFLTHK